LASPKLVVEKSILQNLSIPDSALTLPGQDVFVKKHFIKHPAAGLRVMITDDPYKGYHGIILDSVGSQENKFSIELEAMVQTVVVDQMKLIPHS